GSPGAAQIVRRRESYHRPARRTEADCHSPRETIQGDPASTQALVRPPRTVRATAPRPTVRRKAGRGVERVLPAQHPSSSRYWRPRVPSRAARATNAGRPASQLQLDEYSWIGPPARRWRLRLSSTRNLHSAARYPRQRGFELSRLRTDY